MTSKLQAELIAHLRDYIDLMAYVWPGQGDAVKARAAATLAEVEILLSSTSKMKDEVKE